MKRIMTIVGIMTISLFLMTGCGNNSIEKDAKRVAELQCKAQKLMTQATSGDISILAESQKLGAEAASLQKELEGKYTSDSDKEKFTQALLKEMSNCK
jgi:hypothetical protein